MLNYHEMTMSEPKNSPHKKKQFAVTCTVIAAVIIYSVMTSGMLVPIAPTQGIFPGGHFCYKFATRDYSSSKGLARDITETLIKEHYDGDDVSKERVRMEEITYHLYLDDPSKSGGKRLRFMSGILVDNKGKDKIKNLMTKNDETMKREFTRDELHDLSASEVFKMIPFEKNDLPSVDALVLQFPYTNGVVSMLVHAYKVIPQMRQLAKQKGVAVPVVLTTCSKGEQMCTHYAPLVKGEKFLLGRPDSETYNEALGPESVVDWYGMKKSVVDGATKLGTLLKIV